MTTLTPDPDEATRTAADLVATHRDDEYALIGAIAALLRRCDDDRNGPGWDPATYRRPPVRYGTGER